MTTPTTAETIADELRAMGYEHGMEVVVDDLAIAADAAGFDYDLNDDADLATLTEAANLI